MSVMRLLWTGWVCFCMASFLAEAGLLAVLWQRGLLSRQTAERLLLVAYDVPLGEMRAKLLARTEITNREMVSFAELQQARALAKLDLDLRDMSADKGLMDLRVLDQKVDFEKNSYTKMKDDFDQRWLAMRSDEMDGALQEVRRQIEAVSPKLALDQLSRILDDKSLDASAALHHVVTIFKSLPADKRKRIVAEFQQTDSARLQEILREIRLGTPQSTLIRDARRRLAEEQPES